MRSGGHVYISVPVGIEKIEFNAHRIFNPNTIINAFDKMELVEFSVTSSLSTQSVIAHASPDVIATQDNPGGTVFGLFEFIKL